MKVAEEKIDSRREDGGSWRPRVVRSHASQLERRFATLTRSAMVSLRSLYTLAFFAPLCLAHLIEVPAGKKECFFEDLHVNDKVRGLPYCYKLES